VVGRGKCIIGYFGALAKWFDYELVMELARAHPEYEILLIGWDYDRSLNAYPVREHSNITVIGPIDYKVLPHYACWFDVSMIPFRINEKTGSIWQFSAEKPGTTHGNQKQSRSAM
jgi:hypothetical protein